MPLGKISSNQIKMAFGILTELNNVNILYEIFWFIKYIDLYIQLIDKTDVSKSLILDASNRFYTLIPHDFGMKRPTLLESSKLIKVGYFFYFFKLNF